MLYPNEIQAAVLFDQPVANLDEIVRAFGRIEEGRSGHRFNVPEAKPGVFYRLFGGGDELMVTIEYLNHPCNPAVFQQVLGSTVTGIIFPDVRQRLMTHKSHVLINVSHGVLGNAVTASPDIAAFLSSIDYPKEGHSLAQFAGRMDVCGLIARIACDHAPASAIHWTQSNQLWPADKFDTVAGMAAPSPLHIHPFLFGSADGPDGKARVGIRSFGGRHFIGHELLVEPSELPWAANFETMLTVVRIAISQNGYIIPDGDTFGPEDGSLSYRVTHRPAEDGDVPTLVLTPLMYREYGFRADDYVPKDRKIDDRAPPAALMPDDDDARMQLVNEWREKRKLAEGLGGSFEVRSRNQPPGATPPAPPTPPSGFGGGFGARPVFGRKKA